MKTIKLTCDCGYIYPQIYRDKDAPKTATSMGCNFCPICEDTAKGYYEEWYNFEDEGDAGNEDPNQLMLFSIADDILNKQDETVKELTFKE